MLDNNKKVNKNALYISSNDDFYWIKENKEYARIHAIMIADKKYARIRAIIITVGAIGATFLLFLLTIISIYKV